MRESGNLSFLRNQINFLHLSYHRVNLKDEVEVIKQLYPTSPSEAPPSYWIVVQEQLVALLRQGIRVSKRWHIVECIGTYQ